MDRKSKDKEPYKKNVFRISMFKTTKSFEKLLA